MTQQFGSLQNNILARSIQDAPAPVVGIGATILLWTDRHAATIVEVKSGGKLVGVRKDKVTRTDSNGMSESQTYRFEPNIAAPVEWFSRRKNGRYEQRGSTFGFGLRIGDRQEYRDFSF